MDGLLAVSEFSLGLEEEVVEGQWRDMRVTEVVSGAGLKFGQPRKKFRLSLDVGAKAC